MIAAFTKWCVVDTFTNRSMSMHDSELEAALSCVRQQSAFGAFAVRECLVHIEPKPAAAPRAQLALAM
jgi:hypothetical protein